MKKLYVLTKLSDNVFNGKHPNGIFQGYQVIGEVSDLKIGQSFNMLKYNGGFFQTSTITEIIKNEDDHKIFKTLNSTYILMKYLGNLAI